MVGGDSTIFSFSLLIKRTRGFSMKGLRLAQIYCRGVDGVIGSNNSIPWSCQEDMKFFKNMTMYHILIMGRKTYESIVGDNPTGNKVPLDKRISIVITSDLTGKTLTSACDFSKNPHRFIATSGEVIFVSSLEDALDVSIGLLDLISGKNHYKFPYIIPDSTWYYLLSNTVYIIGGAKLYDDTIDKVDIVYENIIPIALSTSLMTKESLSFVNLDLKSKGFTLSSSRQQLTSVKIGSASVNGLLDMNTWISATCKLPEMLKDI